MLCNGSLFDGKSLPVLVDFGEGFRGDLANILEVRLAQLATPAGGRGDLRAALSLHAARRSLASRREPFIKSRLLHGSHKSLQR